jgi:hypothetical protein
LPGNEYSGYIIVYCWGQDVHGKGVRSEAMSVGPPRGHKVWAEEMDRLNASDVSSLTYGWGGPNEGQVTKEGEEAVQVN